MKSLQQGIIEIILGLTCGSDRKIKLFNPKSGLMIKMYAGHGDEVNDAVGSCESSFILSGSSDKSIIYWDVATGLPVRRLRTHAGAVSCVKFNEDSSVAISGGRDNTVSSSITSSLHLSIFQLSSRFNASTFDLELSSQCRL